MGVLAWVVMAALLLFGAVAGFLMYRSDFCMAGAFRDIFLFQSFNMIRPLVLLVTLSALLFELTHLLGWLPVYPFPWFSPPAGVNLIGGLIFGVGMVLAGGCVVGVLYKMGSGSLLAAIAFLGLLVGSALYAEIHPWWIAVAKQTVLTSGAVTLPQLLALPSAYVVLFLVAAGSFLCLRWQQAGFWRTRNSAEGFVPRWLTACALAFLGLLTVLVAGIPIGVTTSYAKAAALIESWFVPQHLSGLTFFASQSVQYAVPIEGVMRAGGAGPNFDVVAMLQVPLILGIVLGSCLSAALLGELRLVWRLPKRQVTMVFVGGVIMALGSRMTPGCNVWHLWGGLPLLTMQSMLFVVGLLPGAWLGSMVLKRVLLTESTQADKELTRWK